jgi:predicted acetyltransferase
VTLAEARGRGAYRALVRERWDEAVRRGTPALVVHAEEPSRRILERIGFERAAAIVELVSDPAVDSGG